MCDAVTIQWAVVFSSIISRSLDKTQRECDSDSASDSLMITDLPHDGMQLTPQQPCPSE